jgi:ferric-dicitrate binding protein FerR (iron transport regulator)
MEKRIIYLFEQYVSGIATQEEKDDLLTWIAGDSKLQQWLEQTWLTSSEKMGKNKKEELLELIHSKLKLRRIVPARFSTWTKVAAAVALLILVVRVFVPSYSDEKPQYLIIEAQRGQKTNINLPDGSKIYLNSESKLIYGSNFNKKARRVKLEGEAYFEIAPNKEFPFVVESEQMSVYALGTAFNISSYPTSNFIRTTLATGKIKIVSLNQTIYLEPNEQASLDIQANTITVRKIDNAQKTIGWLSNQLYFDNTTFEEIAFTLSRIYNIEIHFSSESLKSQRFTGIINNNSLDSVFRILSLTSPIRYEIKNNAIELFEIPQQAKYFR